MLTLHPASNLRRPPALHLAANQTLYHVAIWDEGVDVVCAHRVSRLTKQIQIEHLTDLAV